MSEISNFFSDVTNKKKYSEIVSQKNWQALLYLFICEFGWSQQDFENAEIPFMLDVLDGYTRVKKEEERQAKKASRKR